MHPGAPGLQVVRPKRQDDKRSGEVCSSCGGGCGAGKQMSSSPAQAQRLPLEALLLQVRPSSAATGHWPVNASKGAHIHQAPREQRNGDCDGHGSQMLCTPDCTLMLILRCQCAGASV